MTSSHPQDYYPKYNEGKQEGNNSTIRKQKQEDKDQIVEVNDSTVRLTNDKNKKHVHYCRGSNEEPTINNVKNGASQQNNTTSLGIDKKIKII